MASAAQVAASRINGALSHGPTSDTGKATSSLNALKTGLTGRTVLLPSEDAALYEAHLARFREQFEPVGERELALVQSIADTEWRLARIPSLETGIFALGRMEFADLFPEYDEDSRKILIEAKTFLAYQRQFNNLSIQEGRLRRQADKVLQRSRHCSNPGSRNRKPVWTRPPGSISTQFTRTGKKSTTRRRSGSNLRWKKSKYGPSTSSPICSLIIEPPKRTVRAMQ